MADESCHESRRPAFAATFDAVGDPFTIMAAPAPAVSGPQVLSLLETRFGLAGTLEALVSERDRNFRLTTAGGDRYVVKVSNAAESAAVLDFQARALTHVAAVAPSLPVPAIVATVDGQPLAALDAPTGQSLVRVVTWLSGRPLEGARRSAPLRKNLAALLARLGLALRGYFHPAARHPLLWDVGQAESVAGLVDNIAEPGRRALATANFQHHARTVQPRLATLRAQVIHNDANPDNVLVAADDDERVSGIIDFGDMVHAPLINDLAVLVAYQVVDDPAPVATAAELAAAYHAVCPLEPGEIDVLFDLVVQRLTMSVAICGWRAARHPDNVDYILGSHERYWDTLARLAELDPRQCAAALHAACAAGPSGTAGPERRHRDTRALRARRAALLGPSLSLSYEEPLHIVRGEGAWLYDANGRAYLDAYNNVACVGHSHPDVVAAITAQARLLNTNTRYLHDNIVAYAEALTARLPGELSVCFFVCTGSEANDLAWQIARAATGGDGAIVTEWAYHGNTTAVAQLSPEELGSATPEDWVVTVPAPESYRQAQSGRERAATLDAAIAALTARGRKPAAFFVDTIYTSDGIHIAPDGYLADAWGRVRAAGGLCIADEVQAGFGRTGRHLWGFEQQGVIPDIVTLGKPMGNGHPLAAVVTTPAIAAAFARRRSYFNTFGGNPVSCAAGLAVLGVLERERLQENADAVGACLRAGLDELASRHAVIGDVRGSGLFHGVELVTDRVSKTPATAHAREVMNALCRRNVLVGRTGRHGNVLKIRPPLVFSRANVDQLVAALDSVLGG
ncbi:MAG TPA: aminotransferase class III-fold pyridoxal phosphate-dependent enzyme [Woeseiaceae bacterium]|nr:aminotransferase class III-fold pyridoxal phosphate-dependent enzyme [Woeseiaceae bacterium]